MHDIFSVLIILGILVIFLPQQIRIVKNGTSLGLSPYFMLLGITSVLAQLFNIVILQIPVLQKCKDAGTCFSDSLGVVQVAVLTMALAFNCALFLSYYPKPLDATPEGKYVLLCISLFKLFCFLSFAIILPAYLIAGKDSDWRRSVGQFFGIVCTVLSCIQYIPQIIRTWTTKHVGSLSATTLAIQAPGSFFFAYTIAYREGTDLTTWMSFFVSGIFQVILVCICVYISYFHPDTNAQEDTPEERRAILAV